MKQELDINSLLKETSRSFYLTLRVLPSSIRSQIGLAYLLARTTDTIADTGLVPLERRLNALEALRGRISGSSRGKLDFGDLLQHQASPSEQLLLERCEEALAALAEQTDSDRERIREVLEIITSGQELDLKRFAAGSSKNIVALSNEKELDDYTYRVAGCVGEFWTKMCRAHVFPEPGLEDRFLLENGVRFGKGLQLVNILRDLPVDLRQGRCYLPEETLRAGGLSPGDLLNPENVKEFRPLYQVWLAKAEEHLRAGWAYTNTVPRRCMRIRLACAWPILIGVRTLRRLVCGNVLDPERRIKVSRTEVKRLITRSILSYPLRNAWEGQFQRSLEPRESCCTAGIF
jgi:farnesyl-diphosphate farnesyltransferase